MNITKQVNESHELFINNPNKHTYTTLIESIKSSICCKANAHQNLEYLVKTIELFKEYACDDSNDTYQQFISTKEECLGLKLFFIDFYENHISCELLDYLQGEVTC